MAWVGVSLFSSQQRTKISAKLIQQSKPLNPSIDTVTLDKLEQKRSFDDQELESFTIYTLLSVKGGGPAIPVPLGTDPESLLPTPTPTVQTNFGQLNATPSGNLSDQNLNQNEDITATQSAEETTQ